MERDDWFVSGPLEANTTLMLAHGAGVAMDSPFMKTVARGVAEHGVRVVRFEFPYMAARRRDGRKRPPDRQPVLLDAWREAVAALRREGGGLLAIGGKSLGGRIASMVADELAVDGLICLGYPFHPVGRPERTRIEHLRGLRTPALVLQGERDPFGCVGEVSAYPLSPAIRVHWVADGDHGFKPRKSSGRSVEENLREAVSVAAAFLGELG